MTDHAASSKIDGSATSGIVLLVGAMTLVPVMDGIAKHLSADFHVFQVVWARYFFHLIILLPIILWRYGVAGFLPQRPVAQVLRGGLLLGSTVFFFAAIAVMPLTDALALVFVSPLVVTALSPWLLGERVGIRRWSAVLVGFVGVLIIIRPGAGVFQVGSLLALAAGCIFACYLIATRKLAGSAPPLVTLAYTALIGALVMSLAMLWYWQPPTPADWLAMIAMGGIAAMGHFLLIRAFELAPASTLAPFTYWEIVSMTAIGYVWFGDFPQSLTWLGIAIVIASGIYISFRESRLAQSRSVGSKSRQRAGLSKQ